MKTQLHKYIISIKTNEYVFIANNVKFCKNIYNIILACKIAEIYFVYVISIIISILITGISDFRII